MDAALRKYLPDVEYHLPQGGYFFWIRLPNGMNADKLQHQAQEFKVGFRPGMLFSSQGGMRDYIRVSYVFYEPDELEEGVLRLHKSLEKMK